LIILLIYLISDDFSILYDSGKTPLSLVPEAYSPSATLRSVWDKSIDDGANIYVKAKDRKDRVLKLVLKVEYPPQKASSSAVDMSDDEENTDHLNSEVRLNLL